MLLDDIKNVINRMTDDATDRRLDCRNSEAALIEYWAGEFKRAVIPYMTNDLKNNDWLATKLPNTELVKKLLNARERYVAQGGKLYTADEINDEVHKNRGG